LVKVSVPARVANVPAVGSVTFVAAVEVRVVAKAPEVVRLPPKVIVLPVLFTPVPPYWPTIKPPFQVPDAIVPTVVKFDKLVKVELLVAVIFPAVVAVVAEAALPDVF
jgi:hypothetical protein